MKKNLLTTIMLTATLTIVGSVNAATNTTTTFQSQATLASSCTVSVTDLSYGNVDNTLTTLTANSALTITCSKAVPFNVGMNAGLHGMSGRSPTRYLKGAKSDNTDLLSYGLYQDSAFSKAISDVSPNFIAGTGTGSSQTIPFYSKLSTSYVMPDNYSDTISVTLNY